MKIVSILKSFLFLMTLTGIVLLSSCGDITIKPDNDGGVTITPGGDDSSSDDGVNDDDDDKNDDKHSHSYKLDETASVASTCTVSGTRVWRCECGDSFTDAVAATGHELRSYEGKAPTCTEDGYRSYEKCINSSCTYTTYEIISALGHDNVSYSAKEPNCTDFGWYEYSVCKRCGESDYCQRPATGHSYVNGFCSCGQADLGLHQHKWNGGEIAQQATCTSSGIMKYTCTDERCGDTRTEVISPLGHSSKNYPAKNPTCTVDGWYAYEECERCGFSTFLETPALGHISETVDGKAATCTEAGYTSYEICRRAGCDGVGLKKSEMLSALGHSLNRLPDILPTCTTTGLTGRAECVRSNCDYSTQSVTEALGHIRKTVEGKPATCTEDGYHSYEICVRSGCSGSGIAKPVVIDALDHDNLSYDAKEPTCTEYGWNAYTVCQRCSTSTYSQIAAKGHSLSNGYCSCGYFDDKNHTHVWDAGETVIEANCTSVGQKKYSCACGEAKTEEIPAFGHSNVSYAAKPATCTVDGWYAYVECSLCGYSTFKEAPALGHSYDKGSVTVKPTCTEPGVRTYTCIRGDDSFTTKIEPLGHNFGSWYVAVKPTCEAYGREQRICSNNHTHTETRTVEKLGHNYSTWAVSKDATCIDNGEEKRVCLNDPNHVIIRPISALGHMVDNSTGICSVCRERVKPPLDTPTVSRDEPPVIYWSAVNGAVSYKILISNIDGGKTIYTINSFIDLEQYYGTNTVLQLYITALAAEDSEYIDSAPLEYFYDIPVGSMAQYKETGLGNSVNLLTGSYTDTSITENGGPVSIFNSVLWNRLDADKIQITKDAHHTEVIYSESVEEYTNKLSDSISNKISVSGSVGITGIAKVTAGYSVETTNSYTRETYNNTQTIFYDMNYYYRGYSAGTSDLDHLKTILSEDFLTDAERLENGDEIMTASKFIEKYGTHVITWATYGASFNAHYEAVMSKTQASNTFKNSIKETISAGINATVKCVEVGTEIKDEITRVTESIRTDSTEDVKSKFVLSAVGGNMPVNIGMLDSLTSFPSDSFPTGFDKWAESIKDESDFRLVDVPDDSLVPVWYFLNTPKLDENGNVVKDENGNVICKYQNAIDKLRNYFIDTCNKQCEAAKDKINGMYKDYYDFDEKTGTLIIDLSGLQDAGTENASLAGVLYKDGDTEILNGDAKIITIYPGFSGNQINKVLIKGRYKTNTTDHIELIDNKFDGIYIKFDNDWKENIVIELENFGFIAPAGFAGIDLSEAQSENVTIIINGNCYIKGGDGATSGQAGFAGISAEGKKLTIQGTGNLEVVGGDGARGKDGNCGDSDGTNGEKGGSGGTGGIGLIAANVNISSVNFKVTGGTGGQGGSGGCCNPNGIWGSKEKGGNGGPGGAGGFGVFAYSVSCNNAELIIEGGNGGKGGDRGGVYKGQSGGTSGSYGNGGAGETAVIESCIIIGSATLSDGNAGAKGTGSDCRDH